MNCGFNAPEFNVPLFEEIRKETGTNEVLMNKYQIALVSGIEVKGNTTALVPSEQLVKWWSDNNIPFKLDLNIKGSTEKSREQLNGIVEACKRFVRETQIDVAELASGKASEFIDTKVRANGYTSILARNEAKRHAANIIMAIVDKVGIDSVPRNTRKQYFKDAIREKLIMWAARRIAEKQGINATTTIERNGRTVQVYTKEFIALRDAVKNEGPSYVTKNLADGVVQNENLVAMFAEAFNDSTNPITQKTYADEFFEEVFVDGRLSEVGFSRDDEFNQQPETEALNAENELNETDTSEEGTPQEDDVTNAIALFEHSGSFSDFMKHVSDNIKSYFNSLPKLVSHRKVNGAWNYDKNNLLGITDTMDATACSMMLYHQGDFTNIDSFINSVRRIAERYKGFESFAQLAEKMELDYNFAYELYCTFGKLVMAKQEVVVEDNRSAVRQSNSRSDKVSALTFELINTTKSALVGLDHDTNSSDITVVTKRLNVKSVANAIVNNPDSATAKRYIEELTNLMRIYYPTIDKYVVSAFIYGKTDKSGKVNVLENIKTLCEEMQNVVKAAKESERRYNLQQYNIAKAAGERFKAIRERKYAEARRKERELQSLYAYDYYKPSTNRAVAMAELLAPYAVVKLELNSRNALGNQSSDVLNNNMITNLINTLQSSLNEKDENGNYKEDCPLQHYKEFKFKSKQYALSNILVEKRDANGRIINYGLFRKQPDGSYVPTSYATELLRCSVFNGAVSRDTGNNVLYNSMNGSDYLITAFNSFFGDTRTIGDESIKFGSYFMRIPSDAPKTFTISAPRYSISGLFQRGGVNVEHPIFRQLVLNFSQELMDAAIAIDTMFDTKPDGSIARDADKKPIFKPGFSNTGEGANNLYKVYHYDGKQVYTEDKNGEEHLTGRVFESNRFTVFINGKERNYGQELIDEMIDFFYGGAREGKMAIPVVRDLDGKITGIAWRTDDGKRLLQAINAKLQEFVTDYCSEAVSRMSSHKRYILETNEDIFNTRASRNELSKLREEIKKKYDDRIKEYKNNEGRTVKSEERKAHIERLEAARDKEIEEAVAENETRLDNEFKLRVAEFVLNHHLMYINFDDLFEGNSKFYKKGRDFLKRAKEVQGSGVPYGVVNYNAPFSPTGKNRLNHSAFTTKYIKSIVGNDVSNDIVARIAEIGQYDAFSAVTVKNTVRLSETVSTELKEDGTFVGSLTEHLRKVLIKSGLTEAEAREKAAKMLDGYKNTKVNDAQSYITFEEWVRRIAAQGQLNKYLPLISKLLDPNSKLDSSDIDAFVQIQKNFYYDMHYDETTGIIAPRQIKNAEFVLIPRFIQGTELEQVYKVMTENNIDQLNTEETSKAGKRKVLELWDTKTGRLKNTSAFAKEVGISGAIEYYSYNNLYKQQDSVQHVNARNKAGIQIMKKMLDNITKDSPLWKTKQRFMRLYGTKVINSFARLMDDLGVELDEDGNIVFDADGKVQGLDKEVIFARLREEAERLGMDSNMADFLTLDPYTKTPRMPNLFNVSSGRIESVAQAVFNSNITRQKLPGFHAEQVTGVGFVPLVENENKTYTLKTDENVKITKEEFEALSAEDKALYRNSQVRYSKQLRYHPDGKPYIEVYLPRSNFGFARNPDYKLKDGVENKSLRKGISKEEYNKLSRAEKANYEIDGSYKYDDATLLKQLQDAGLDEIIGYRIPTEGKQSVAIMKVVGFLDDTQGSAIVVPDEWVAQTGSDFDFDSIYGIQFNTYIDKYGKIRKNKYEDDDSEKATRDRWHAYIKRSIDEKVENPFGKKQERVDAAKKAISEVFLRTKEAANEVESKTYHALPDAVREAIKIYDAEYKKEYGVANTRDKYLQQLKSRMRFLDEDLIPNVTNEEVKGSIQDFYNAMDAIVDNMENFGSEIRQQTGEAINNTIATMQQEFEKAFEDAAKTAGLMSFEQFAKLPVSRQNADRAIDNQIVEDMLTIMRADESLEENLSRSNFEEVTNALNKMLNKETKDRNFTRSPYNILDQADNQSDAMSGAKLKGFSVTRDTFCSICNTVRPRTERRLTYRTIDLKKQAENYDFIDAEKVGSYTKEELRRIGQQIIATYPSDVQNRYSVDVSLGELRIAEEEPALYSIAYSKDLYSREQLEKRFGTVRELGNCWVVEHTMFGWSNDNKNIDGFILTSYSSQTTAHILDAIKEGSVPNVNDYTFAVYKTFVDLGSNYDTAVGFMLQPAITRVVNAYNRNNSIYAISRGNPIHNAIRELAQSVGVETKVKKKNRKLADVINDIIAKPEVKAAFTELFGVVPTVTSVIGSDIQFDSFPLRSDLLKDRINSTGIFAKNDDAAKGLQTAFDLATILKFSQYLGFSNNIGNCARVLNPDKFGAKQTIYSTNKVFDDIKSIMVNNQVPLFVDREDGSTINLIDSIYPGIGKGNYKDFMLSVDDQSSTYYPLYCFLKYSSAPAIAINSELFETENTNFKDVVNSVSNLRWMKESPLSEEVYNDYKKYILTSCYSECDFVRFPITIDGDKLIPDLLANVEEERQRIFGYNRPVTATVRRTDEAKGVEVIEDFEVKNFLEPTNEEIEVWKGLSPAQKVMYIQQHTLNGDIFDMLQVDLRNNNRNGRQTISFIEGNRNIEEVYQAFNRAMYSTNPLIRLAAIDLIKYAFATEGFQMKRNSVTKCIANDCLMATMDEGGTSIATQMIDKVNNISVEHRDNTTIAYARSHPKSKLLPLVTTEALADLSSAVTIPNRDGQAIPVHELRGEAYVHTNGGYVIHITDENRSRLIEERIYRPEDSSCVPVIRTQKGNLYRIVASPNDASTIYVYPLNTLEESENSEWSANPANNVRPSDAAFTAAIYTGELTKEQHEYRGPRVAQNTIAAPFNINSGKNPQEQRAFDAAKNQVRENKATLDKATKTSVAFIYAPVLEEYMPNKKGRSGVQYGSVQEIDGVEYIIYPVNIVKKASQYLETNKAVSSSDANYEYIINKLKGNGSRVAKHVYGVIRKDVIDRESQQEIVIPAENEESMGSTRIEGTISSTIKAMNINMEQGDTDARHFVNELASRGIYTEANSFAARETDALSSVSEYLTKKVTDLIDKLNAFHVENGVAYGVLSDKVKAIILKDPARRREYLQLMLEVRKIQQQFREYTAIGYDSNDVQMKALIDNITEQLRRLDAANIENAFEFYAKEYLSKISTNPLIQKDIIDILDGFYGSGILEAMIHDTQEMPNPLIQIITKDVMADIRAKELQAQQRIKKFRQDVAAIEQEAIEAGHPINWDNIIDENGDFITGIQLHDEDVGEEAVENVDADSIQRILNDGTKNVTQKADAIWGLLPNNDKGFLGTYNYYNKALRYLRLLMESDNRQNDPAMHLAIAKIELKKKKWLKENVEQELKTDLVDELTGRPIDDFYDKEIKLIENMINNQPEAYGKYLALKYMIRQHRRHENNGTVDEAHKQKAEQYEKELKDLTSEVIYDVVTGTISEKPAAEKKQAKALNKFEKDRRALYTEYFDSDAVETFEATLNRYLAIINRYERPDRYGRATIAHYILKDNEEYMRAKDWVRKNARWVVNEAIREQINDAFKVLTGVSKKSAIGAMLKHMATAQNAYDENGDIDGTKLTKEQQAQLKTQQENEYRARANSAFNQRTLINNAPENNEIYTFDFYKALSANIFKNPEYLERVKKINAILGKHYNARNKSITWVNMTNEELEELRVLYNELREVQYGAKDANTKKVIKFEKENVEWYDGTTEFETARYHAELAGLDMDLWMLVNTEPVVDENGNPMKDGNGRPITRPNRYIYSYPKPNAAARAKTKTIKGKRGNPNTTKPLYIDVEKTEALNIIHGYMSTSETDYYFEEYQRRLQQDKRGEVDADGRTFQQWFDDNHVYDPVTKSTVPIRCWTSSKINVNAGTGQGEWVPMFSQSRRTPKAEYVNPNYRDDADIVSLYKGHNYDAVDRQPSEYETKMMNLLRNTIMSLATTHAAKKYFEEGHMVTRHKPEDTNVNFYLKEVAKLAGWAETSDGNERFDENVNYEHDWIPNMPMAQKLMSPKTIELLKKRPVKKNYDTEEDYEHALNAWKKALEDAKADDVNYHREHIDRNWVDVMCDFMERAAHYNAVQDNKYQLYYGQSILRNQQIYETNFGDRDLKQDRRESTEEHSEYVTRKADRELQQYTNWIRRLIFDQWKIPNKHWTKGANVMQSITSANFMMANIRGGIANVTLGETQILAEAWAREYFNTKEYAQGKTIWSSGIISYFADMYKDTSSTLAGAFIKQMNVVDFDEINGVKTVDMAAKGLERMRDWMFSPQSMGEHFMQNGVLFSLALSNKLYLNTNPEENGRTKYVLKGRAEVLRDAHEEAMLAIATQEQKDAYKSYKQRIKGDKNMAKEAAWFRMDVTTEFINKFFTKEQQQEYQKNRKELEDKALEEYEQQPSLWDQLELGEDGKVAFKKDSILAMECSAEDEDGISDAFRILGAFKGRVISVNKKIHGVYDKMGSAQIEKYWWGSLVMQYHKHIYPGIMKRWRRHGYYNEERGTIEKGSYIALYDFLTTPIRTARQKNNALRGEFTDTDSDRTLGIEATKNILASCADFFFHIKHHYNNLPEYEKANIRRNLGDVFGVLSALCFAVFLHGIGDDDDEGWVYNLALYEADRLSSESFMFNPIGAAVEAKKLWSNPTAVQSIVGDAFNSLGIISQMIMEGEDFDPYYKSGKYAGEHKLKVYITRRIPIYRAINSIINIGDDNHYYRLGKSMLGMPVQPIGNWLGKNVFGNGGH